MEQEQDTKPGKQCTECRNVVRPPLHSLCMRCCANAVRGNEKGLEALALRPDGSTRPRRRV